MPETRDDLRAARRRAERPLETEYGWPTRSRPSRWRFRLRAIAMIELVAAAILATYGAGLTDSFVPLVLAIAAALSLAAAEIPS